MSIGRTACAGPSQGSSGGWLACRVHAIPDRDAEATDRTALPVVISEPLLWHLPLQRASQVGVNVGDQSVCLSIPFPLS